MFALSVRKWQSASTSLVFFSLRTLELTSRTMRTTSTSWKSTLKRLASFSTQEKKLMTSNLSIITRLELHQKTLKWQETMQRKLRIWLKLPKTCQHPLLCQFLMPSGVSCGKLEKDPRVPLTISLRSSLRTSLTGKPR